MKMEITLRLESVLSHQGDGIIIIRDQYLSLVNNIKINNLSIDIEILR